MIYGENGNDSIFGSIGNDTIYGGAGDDVLSAGLKMIPSSLRLVAGLTPSRILQTAMTKSTSVQFADITSVDDLSMDQREGDVVIDYPARVAEASPCKTSS